MVGESKGHWFEPLAAHMGGAYLRYSFTKGTSNEIDNLVDLLDLEPGAAVLDVGCGPGRHLHELARRGMVVFGLDISMEFARLAHVDERGTVHPVVRGDARALPYCGCFDAVISLCQGGFGLLGGPGSVSVDPDLEVLSQIVHVLRPGGSLAVSGFSSYFQMRYLEDSDRFDATSGTNHETTEVRGEGGNAIPADLWTTCFTPRELRLMALVAGLDVDGVYSVEPGNYAPTVPDTDSPEYLMIASKPRP